MPQNVLIVFLKYPEPGRVKTRLGDTIGSGQAASIYRILAEQTLSRLLPSTLYTCWVFFDPPEREGEIADWLGSHHVGITLFPQTGGDLGTRISDAFGRCFDEGEATRAVIIGTDCPGVDRTIVEEAFSELERAPVVIGPSRDGGYYLLGMTGNSPWLLNRIAWSTDAVFAQTVRALEARKCPWTALRELQDVDTEADLERVWPSWRDEWSGGGQEIGVPGKGKPA